MQATKKELIYEGKGKKMWSVNESDDLLISEFKDSLTAFNGVKKAEESGKGALNCKISTLIFDLLKKHGIATALVETISPTEQLVKKYRHRLAYKAPRHQRGHEASVYAGGVLL